MSWPNSVSPILTATLKIPLGLKEENNFPLFSAQGQTSPGRACESSQFQLAWEQSPGTGSALGCILCPVPLDGIACTGCTAIASEVTSTAFTLRLRHCLSSQHLLRRHGFPPLLCPAGWPRQGQRKRRNRPTAELLLQEELEVLPTFRVSYQLTEIEGPSLHAHSGGDFHSAHVENKQHCQFHVAHLIGRLIKTKMPFAGMPRDFSALSVFQNAVMSS